MYLLDSDVLINAKNRHYAFDIVPAFWDWLVRAHDLRLVYTVERCAQEVRAGADELADWIRRLPPTFSVSPGSQDQSALQQVSAWAAAAPYRPGAAAEFLAAGDYFLVAQALTRGFVVVTHEEPAPQAQRKIKIPDACNALGVTWMSPYRMLRAEGARFSL